MRKPVVHILFLFLLFGLVLGNLWAGEGTQVVEGEVSQISPTYLTLDGTQYPVVMGESADFFSDALVAAPEVIVSDTGVSITYGTIQAVGYITYARVHLRNGTVFRIDILDMQQ
jgi:hypothetical protein